MRPALSAVVLVVLVALPSLAVAQPSAGMTIGWQHVAPVAGLPGPARQVAVNGATSCAIVGETLFCWGRLHPLGIEGTSATPRAIDGVGAPEQVSIGGSGSCVLTPAKTVLCWGPAFSSATPRAVAGLANVRKVSTGDRFACALRADRRVVCWGTNAAGQLGQQTPSSSVKPLVIPRLDDVVDLAAGNEHACAVRASGALVCWGDRRIDRDESGGTLVVRTGAPVTIAELENVAAVSALDHESCALGRGGELSCFSHGYSRTAILGPQRCVGGVRALGEHSRWALKATGEVVRVGMSCDDPSINETLSAVAEVSGGGDHGCARTSDGKVLCFGPNDSGQLGRR